MKSRTHAYLIVILSKYICKDKNILGIKIRTTVYVCERGACFKMMFKTKKKQTITKTLSQ